MLSVRSLAAGGRDRAGDVAKTAFTDFAANFPVKLWWFASNGYTPHEWQAAFHSASFHDRLCRFRHLVAGRRGGKTMSAAWEVIFYCLFPEVFHQDAHSVSSSRPLWVWVLTKDHEVGRPARRAIQECLTQIGLVSGKDYKWNKSEQTIEFENGSFLQFKTAVDPQSLRGAGLDILWMDEAAFIPNIDAWTVTRPALSDKIGLVVSTTTPQGKNWFYEEFFTKEALEDPHQFRVEYTSIDNPYFHEEEWLYAKAHMHPAMFKQEYMAAFDALAGLALSGEWLQFYTVSKPDPMKGEVTLPTGPDGKVRLRKYLAVDPSTGDSEDEFAICCLGVTMEYDQAFLLDYWKGKIQFPEQIQKLREWHSRWRPELIGVESVAYQKVLAQQANRLEGFPGIVPVMSKGKKSDRIIAMSPLFKIGKVRIHQRHIEFIDQWVSYDPKVRDNKDDLLDAVEIALGVAGVLLPSYIVEEEKPKEMSIHEQAKRQIAGLKERSHWDHELGSEV